MTTSSRIFSHKNYLALIENSVWSTLFRNYFVEEKDIIGNGENACAFYVSSILLFAGYLPRISFTVDGVIFQMWEFSDFFEEIDIKKASIWDVLIWNTSAQSGHHKHIGFCWTDGLSISNSSSKKCIHLHSRDYDGARPVARVYRVKKV